MRLPSRIGVAVTVAGTLAGVLTPMVASAASTRTVRHVGSRPSWATTARNVGPANGADQVGLRVWLALRSAAEARAFATAVSDPKSAEFGHYLTASQFRARYGQTAAEANAVASWLRSVGLTVTQVPSSHQYVAATGSVRQVSKALSVTLDNYRVHGNVWRAPANDPAIPASLASSIVGFTGLDTGDHANHPAARPAPPPPPAFVNADPLSDYYGEKPDSASYDTSYGTASALPAFNGAVLPYAVKGYTPADFRKAYGLSGDGTGTTIAITDAYYSPTIVSDTTDYFSDNGQNDRGAGPLNSSNYAETLASSYDHQSLCDASGWQGEETLDVEVAHGIAPAANIHYFGAQNCLDSGLLVALNNAATDENVNVITNSWSGLESSTTPDVVNAYETVFTTGIAAGKAFLFSSGDDGDEVAATGTKQVDYPSSDPMIISVGGTSVGIDASGAFVGQTGWGTEKASYSNGAWSTPAFLYGSGGGCSALFDAPSYQDGVDTGCATGHGRHAGPSTRGVPDISMDGDPTTGMLVGETQLFPHHTVDYGEYRIGGTSLASPLLAGVLALADQASSGATISGPAVLYTMHSGIDDVMAEGLGPSSDAGNVRADFVNSVDASRGVVFSVRTFGQDSSLTLGTGWDQTTGLGTAGGGFVSALAGALK